MTTEEIAFVAMIAILLGAIAWKAFGLDGLLEHYHDLGVYLPRY